MTTSLSPRQLEIALLIDEGLTNAEIAQAIGISESTVKQHVRDMRLKFGVGRRRELPHILRELGQLQRP